MENSTSIEKSKPLSEQLTQEFNLNNIDGKEPPWNRKKKWILEEFCVSKNVLRKVIKQAAAKTCTSETW